MKLPINIVDAFTDAAFKGNPAGVCILEKQIHDSLKQSIAFEMNHAETAFLFRESDGSFELRWFTPTSEVDLCGHATMASTHILFEKGICKPDETIRFNTKSGELRTSMKNGLIQMDFPAIHQNQIEYPKELALALGAKPVYVGMTKWNYLVELEGEEAIRKVQPDYQMLKSLPGWGTIITARASMEGYDFVSRFFAPEKGVMEDPVTGSAHCALGPYWMGKLGKNQFKAYQASERGGTVIVRVEGDRVFLSGKAVTVLSGEIEV